MVRHKELIDGCHQARLLDRLVKGTAVAGASPPSLSVLQPWPARHAQRWRGGGRKADGQCTRGRQWTDEQELGDRWPRSRREVTNLGMKEQMGEDENSVVCQCGATWHGT